MALDTRLLSTDRRYGTKWARSRSTMSAASFGIGLLLRLCVVERRKLEACRLDALQCREGVEIGAAAPGIRHLRDEADIGQRRRIAVAEAARLGRTRQHRFD